MVKRISCKELAEVDLDIFKQLGLYYLTYKNEALNGNLIKILLKITIKD